MKPNDSDNDDSDCNSDEDSDFEDQPSNINILTDKYDQHISNHATSYAYHHSG